MKIRLIICFPSALLRSMSLFPAPAAVFLPIFLISPIKAVAMSSFPTAQTPEQVTCNWFNGCIPGNTRESHVSCSAACLAGVDFPFAVRTGVNFVSDSLAGVTDYFGTGESCVTYDSAVHTTDFYAWIGTGTRHMPEFATVKTL